MTLFSGKKKKVKVQLTQAFGSTEMCSKMLHASCVMEVCTEGFMELFKMRSALNGHYQQEKGWAEKKYLFQRNNLRKEQN